MVTPEVWLRGNIAGIPIPLQPVAHALLQALEDAEQLVLDVSLDELWTEPGGAASIGFHLRHMAGSLDRLLTYARGEGLSSTQRAALAIEKTRTPEVASSALLAALRDVVGHALEQLRGTAINELDSPRAVGRAGHPSSVRGLLHHAGERTARHAGQISTTLRIIRAPTRNPID